jgi:hypothetical protein
MPVYLVHRDLPGISMDDLARAQRTAISASNDEVRYLRSVWVPGEEHCMCLFEGPALTGSPNSTRSPGCPTPR